MSNLDQTLPETMNIVGCNVADLSLADALTLMHARIEKGVFTPVTFLNAHNGNVAQRDDAFSQALENFTILADGIGVDIAAKILYGQSFKANLNGTDFIPALLASAEAPLKVGLYGAKPGIAERAADAFKQHASLHDIRVMGHGYLDGSEQANMLNELKAWHPDILLVAKGVPAQEMWIAEHLNANHCTLAFGIGALFDFAAGNVARAPEWMRAARLEWVYRLIQEPSRLWKRYVLGNPLFITHVIKQRLGLGRTQKASDI